MARCLSGERLFFQPSSSTSSLFASKRTWLPATSCFSASAQASWRGSKVEPQRLQDALQGARRIAHQILVMHHAVRDRFQRPADLLVDQLVAEDVLEKAAMLARHGVDLPLGVAHDMHRIDVELRKPHQIGETLGQLRRVDDEILAGDVGDRFEHDRVRRFRSVGLAIVEHIEIGERLARGLAGARIDARPDRALPKRRRPAGAGHGGLLARMVDAELPVELQHLTRREDRGMGVEHQVEQRRPAMARSGDVDHPHGRRCITSRSVWLKPPRALSAP